VITATGQSPPHGDLQERGAEMILDAASDERLPGITDLRLTSPVFLRGNARRVFALDR